MKYLEMLSLNYLSVDCEYLHEEKSNVSTGSPPLTEALSLVPVYVKASICFTLSDYSSL